MREIGGYFGLDDFINNEYYKNLVTINTGRNALLYVCKAKGIRKLYIPYFLCDSISNMLVSNKYEFDYYHIDKNFNPIFNKKLNQDEFLYIVNYYGQIEDERLIFFKERYKQIIVDNTQAFFQRPLSDIDTIYSCRKYFGVPDGAYLSTKCRLNKELSSEISKNRMSHILGRFEGKASEYYSDFQKNDNTFKNEPLKYMSKLSRNILKAIDYEKVQQTRNLNFSYLKQRLDDINILDLAPMNAPFAYPLYIKNAMEIKKRLIKKKIYIPTLWPNVMRDSLKESIEYKYAANIMPLPCDQRYNEEDMQYMVEEVIKCIN